MAGIAGASNPNQMELVNRMLDRIAHRGRAGKCLLREKSCVLGVVWPESQVEAGKKLEEERIAADEGDKNQYARAEVKDFLLKRDPVGVAPLYYGHTTDGILCFASEVKALLTATQDVNELPPGHSLKGKEPRAFKTITQKADLQIPVEEMTKELCKRLENAIQAQIDGNSSGVWLSGGLDSSLLAALVRPHVKELHTFSAGLPTAPDLKCARKVAQQLKTKHHEVIVSLKDILAILPEVIYFLESFDALLVRSSVMNYLTAKVSSKYTPSVFSGEGADELFAGYEYYKNIPADSLGMELVESINRLHNTALQRVDRCSAAHGLRVHTSFLDPEVVDYALQIPSRYKIVNGVEKWILRQAAAGKLPEDICLRAKAKFWDGAGLGGILAQNAEIRISKEDFEREKRLPNGWTLNSKEELMYYRIFQEHFGKCENLAWMGRTKVVT